MNKSRSGFILITIALLAVLLAWLFWQQATPTPASMPAHQAANQAAAAAPGASSTAVTSAIDDLEFAPGNEDHPGLLAAPQADKFDMMVVEDHAALLQYLTPAQHKQSLAVLKDQHCNSPKITVYAKKDLLEKLLVSDCHYLYQPEDKTIAPYYDTDYSIMLAVNMAGVFELKGIKRFKYLYEVSHLAAVTRLPKNGHLQLWLDADTCEPSAPEEETNASQASSATAGGSPESCKSTGIVEIINDKMLLTKR
ncbi:hypothetical protein ACO0LC_10920 [Undibacterium sp. JH2W]|uniref:hypothetical protein n=1 Tax=Undibacterium sp. JH2W TaxID=3413037 RepID=UPI003BF2CFE7